MGKEESEIDKKVDPGYTSAQTVTKPKVQRAKKPKPPGQDLVAVHNLSQENLLHAHEVGGLAAPSLAVAGADHPFDAFGDVTLVAPHHLIDPARGVPVFDADVYSPRYPTVHQKVDDRKYREFREWLKPHAEKTGTYTGDADEELERRGPEDAIRYKLKEPLMSAYLAEKGRPVAPAQKTKAPGHDLADTASMRAFMAKHGIAQDALDDPKKAKAFHAAARQAVDDVAGKMDDPEDQQYIKDLHLKDFDPQTGQMYLGPADKLRRSMSDLDKQVVDKNAVRLAQEASFRELAGVPPEGGAEEHPEHAARLKAQERDYEAWAHAKLKPVMGDRYIPKHLDSGGTRKIPYTIDNVLKEMTRKVRGAETGNSIGTYGLGAARSFGAKKFKSLDEVRQHRARIVPREEFERIKKASDDQFESLVDQVSHYHPNGGGFGMMGALAEAIGESYKRGHYLYRELAESGFKDVPPALRQKIGEFADNLRTMPSQYFEAKPQRVVGLHEFQGAAVPEDVDPRVLEALRAHGVTNVHKYRRESSFPDAKSYEERRKLAEADRARATRASAEHQDLKLSEDLAKAEAPKVAHGEPAVIPYVHRRNALPTPYHGEVYNQHLEPAGTYLSPHDPGNPRPPALGEGMTKTWYEYGDAHFQRPWVHRMQEDESPVHWKKALSDAHGGRRGKVLTNHLLRQGYDGVVALHPDGDVSEMVDFGGARQPTHPLPDDAPRHKRASRKLGKSEELEKGYAQRALRFNPDELDPNDEADMADMALWQGPDRSEENRSSIRYMGGPERTRALMRLTAATRTRRNPTTGEAEFLLHRGVGPEEQQKATVDPARIAHEDVSSWTPRFSLARNMAKEYNPKEMGGGYSHVLSAWIPASAVHSVPRMYGQLSQNPTRDLDEPKPRGTNEYGSEHEVIVAPHSSERAHEKVDFHVPGRTHPKDIDSVISGRQGGSNTADFMHKMGTLKRSESLAKDEGDDHPHEILKEVEITDKNGVIHRGHRWVKIETAEPEEQKPAKIDTSEERPYHDRPQVALIMAYDANGRMLLGVRKDNGKHTLPGGHLEGDEAPAEGAARELREETGLTAYSMTEVPGIRDNEPGKGPQLHVFSALVSGVPHGNLDPDREAATWAFHDVSEGVPPEVWKNLHGPEDDSNVVRQVHRELGKAEADDDLDDLLKTQPAIDFPKLGVERRNDTPIVTTRQQHALHERLMGAAQSKRLADAGLPMNADIVREKVTKRAKGYLNRRTAIPRAAGTVSVVPGSRAGYVLHESLIPAKAPEEYRSPNAAMATQIHEDFHQAVSRAADKHGLHRDRILFALRQKVPVEARSAAAHLSLQGMGVSPKDPNAAEEFVANLHSYLNNPQARTRVFSKLRFTPEQARAYDQRVKQAYRAFSRAAAELVPQDLRRSEELDKRISDIPAGVSVPTTELIRKQTHDYSHVLTPEHRAAGYGLRVETSRPDDVEHRNAPVLTAHLMHRGTQVGEVVMEPTKLRGEDGETALSIDAVEPHSQLAEGHRGKGLGTAMYEAAYRHAQLGGARTIQGDAHTKEAARVHEALARKHGLEYRASGKGAYRPAYAYALKSEDLDKAIPNIPKGKKVGDARPQTISEGTPFGESFDYSHLLPEDQRHLKLTVEHTGHRSGLGDEAKVHAEEVRALLHDTSFPRPSGEGVSTAPVGYVKGYVHGPHDPASSLPSWQRKESVPRERVSPHSELLPSYHGKGLGQAMYEAVYAHAHGLGVQTVQGGSHSRDAHRLHQRLAAKHGFTYEPKSFDPKDREYPWGSYSYPLTQKAEAEGVEPDENLVGPGKFIVFSRGKTKSGADQVVQGVRAAMTDELRKPHYQDESNPMRGHCYIASEAVYHILGGPGSGYVPQTVRHEGGVHWYLRHGKTGAIVDPTADQFATAPPYAQGRGCGFLTSQPSRRAHDVISRVLSEGSPVTKPEDLEKADTPEFQAWFQGSHVKTPEGQPLRVYHGTSKDKDFRAFKVSPRGSWFSSDPEEASMYASTNDAQASRFDHATGRYQPINRAARVIPAYLSLKNPYYMTPEDMAQHNTPNYARAQAGHFRKLQHEGYDGAVFPASDPKHKTYVAFHPHQIKSVFNERPTEHKDFGKSEALLQHPDARERTLAVMTQPLSHHQLLKAVLDEHPEVRHAALKHANMTPGLLRLACAARRTAQGGYPGLMLVDFLEHPMASKDHAKVALASAEAHGQEGSEAANVARQYLARP